MAPSGKAVDAKQSSGSFFGIRRKSVPKMTVFKEQAPRIGEPTLAMPGRATMIEKLSQPAPRQKSSWYSQLSLSEEAIAIAPVPVPVPKVPDQYLSSRAVRENTANGYTPVIKPDESRKSIRDSWEDESPGGTRRNSDTSYSHPQPHTAASEYIRDRSWVQATPRSTMPGTFVEEYPQPSTPHPSTPSKRPLSMLNPWAGRRGSRRDSYSSDVSLDEPEEQPRRGSILQQASRRASSVVTKWPYSMLAKAQPRDESPVSPASSVTRAQIPNLHTPRTPHTPSSEPFIAKPYHTTQQGPAPTPVRSVNSQSPPEADPNAGMKRGLTKHYGKGVARHTSITSTTISSARPPPSYHTSTYEPRTPYPPTSGSRLLMGGNGRAREYSNQGYWLYIGTMRGPTPEGVRMINEMMAKSLSKKGNTEKCVKEIRKVLRHEKRTVIEWVENYVRRKWGVEV